MGNKAGKKSRTSTELTPKGFIFAFIFLLFFYYIFLFTEISMLKANTKFSEEGRLS